MENYFISIPRGKGKWETEIYWNEEEMFKRLHELINDNEKFLVHKGKCVIDKS